MRRIIAGILGAALLAGMTAGCGQQAPQAPAAQTQEEAQETAEETVEETAEETVEETVEETAEETVEETVEETAEETAEETVEETAEETAGETAQEAGPQAYSTVTFAMDTVMELKVWSEDGDAAQELLRDGVRMILDLEREFSVTDEKSEISAINRAAGKEVEVGGDVTEVLTRGLKVCEDADGCLDLSIYPVVRAWGFTTGSYRVVPREELDELLERVDYRRVSLEEKKDGGVVRIPEGMEIDLGSVAKGYTSERLCRLFAENGITSAMVNLGGNVQTLGSKTDGSAWKVGIQDPEGNGIACAVPLVDKAIITSGGYERYFEEDGKIYRHIIDPRTGETVDNDLLSVTIIGSDALVCDGLATALFVMGAEKACEYIKTRDDVDVILITTDHNFLATEGICGDMVLYGDYTGSEIIPIKR